MRPARLPVCIDSARTCSGYQLVFHKRSKNAFISPTIDSWKISKRQNLVEGLEFAGGGDVECFSSIVPVSDIGSDQALGQEDCEKDPNLHGRVRWETDCYTSAVRSEILCKRANLVEF